tara:strand:- start:170 stop:493 length:324 start_codon:yes stop_codon:yes gene_type:complete
MRITTLRMMDFLVVVVAEDLLLIVEVMLEVDQEILLQKVLLKEMMEALVIKHLPLVTLIELVAAVVVLVVLVLQELILVVVMVEMVRHTLDLLDLYFQRCQQVGRML